jgi:hypothetical protein
LSGKLETLVREIPFKSIKLWVDDTEISLVKFMASGDLQAISINLESPNVKLSKMYTMEGIGYKEFDEKTKSIFPGTVFFPTFRRIEGGFSIIKESENAWHLNFSSTPSLHAAMQGLSQSLSRQDHLFVASMSTDDLMTLLTEKYSAISQATNKMHIEMSQRIKDIIGTLPTSPDNSTLIRQIQEQVETVGRDSEQRLRPFAVLQNLVVKILSYKGISVGEGILLGDKKDPIPSHLLSAGEKQMLGFLCYNAFATNSCIFIDEPEISLHVDWQRMLFPTLLEQSTGNQFFISTHSPFIYARYPDKEIQLNPDRGNRESANATING